MMKTPVPSPDTAPFEEILRRTNRAAVVSHYKPDGDAAGSLMACTHYLRTRGIEVTPVLPSPLSHSLSFLAPEESGLIVYEQNPEAADAAISSADTIICLDFNQLSRTEHLVEQIGSSKAAKVLIDHHVYCRAEEFDLVYSSTAVSSASELLFWILMRMEDVADDASNLPMPAAECLYTGMMTDTNNFANSVAPPTLEMAARLLERGVDKNDIQFRVLNSHTASRMRLMGHLLKDKMTLVEEFGAAYIILTEEEKRIYDFHPGDSEGFVNLPLSIAGIRLSAFFTECVDDGYFRVSLRSRPGTDVNAFSNAYFNGGGHVNAAGGRLYLPKEEIAAYFLKSLKGHFGNE